MTSFGAADLPAMIAPFGVPVTLGGVTVQAIEDTPDASFLEATGSASLVDRTRTYRVPTGSLPALAVGATITIRGVNYKVSEHRAEGDGALTVITAVRS